MIYIALLLSLVGCTGLAFIDHRRTRRSVETFWATMVVTGIMLAMLFAAMPPVSS